MNFVIMALWLNCDPVYYGNGVDYCSTCYHQDMKCTKSQDHEQFVYLIKQEMPSRAIIPALVA